MLSRLLRLCKIFASINKSDDTLGKKDKTFDMSSYL